MIFVCDSAGYQLFVALFCICSVLDDLQIIYFSDLSQMAARDLVVHMHAIVHLQGTSVVRLKGLNTFTSFDAPHVIRVGGACIERVKCTMALVT